MPFLRFAIPFVRPVRWDVLLLAAAVPILLGRPETWYLAVANGAGFAVALTMGVRCAGGWPTWFALLGSIGVPAGWSAMRGELELTPTTALYGALGMGLIAWFRVRHELTYRGRVDIMMGFATLGLVGLALIAPRLLHAPFRWIHVIAFVWAAIVLAAVPRDWDASASPGTGSPGPGSLLDRTPP